MLIEAITFLEDINKTDPFFNTLPKMTFELGMWLFRLGVNFYVFFSNLHQMFCFSQSSLFSCSKWQFKNILYHQFFNQMSLFKYLYPIYFSFVMFFVGLQWKNITFQNFWIIIRFGLFLNFENNFLFLKCIILSQKNMWYKVKLKCL